MWTISSTSTYYEESPNPSYKESFAAPLHKTTPSAPPNPTSSTNTPSTTSHNSQTLTSPQKMSSGSMPRLYIVNRKLTFWFSCYIWKRWGLIVSRLREYMCLRGQGWRLYRCMIPWGMWWYCLMLGIWKGIRRKGWGRVVVGRRRFVRMRRKRLKKKI